jgi:hypothetical protein
VQDVSDARFVFVAGALDLNPVDRHDPNPDRPSRFIGAGDQLLFLEQIDNLHRARRAAGACEDNDTETSKDSHRGILLHGKTSHGADLVVCWVGGHGEEGGTLI